MPPSELPRAEEYIDLEHLPPAHTGTDIHVRFAMGDVMHLGDTQLSGHRLTDAFVAIVYNTL